MMSNSFNERDKKLIRFVLIKMLSTELEDHLTNKSIIKIFPSIVDFADKYAKELERSIIGNEALKEIREDMARSERPEAPHVEVTREEINGVPGFKIMIDPMNIVPPSTLKTSEKDLYEEVRKELKKDDLKDVFDWFTKRFKK